MCLGYSDLCHLQDILVMEIIWGTYWIVLYGRPAHVIPIISLVIKRVTLFTTFGKMSCNLFWTETGGWAEYHEAVVTFLLILAAFSLRVVLNSSLVQQTSLASIYKQTWVSQCIFSYLHFFFNTLIALRQWSSLSVIVLDHNYCSTVMHNKNWFKLS